MFSHYSLRLSVTVAFFNLAITWFHAIIHSQFSPMSVPCVSSVCQASGVPPKTEITWPKIILACNYYNAINSLLRPIVRVWELCFSWLQTLWRVTASHTGLCFRSSTAGRGADGCWQDSGAQVIAESCGPFHRRCRVNDLRAASFAADSEYCWVWLKRKLMERLKT